MLNSKNDLKSLRNLTEPFYFRSKSEKEVGVLLVHGFTASPTEVLPLGSFLHKNGFTVHGVRLAGHGTSYHDLPEYSWHDWYNSVEDGFNYLKDRCKIVIPLGISLGGALCLLLAHRNSDVSFPKLIMLAPIFAFKSRFTWLLPILRLFKKNIYKGDDTLQYYKAKKLYSYLYYPIDSLLQVRKLLGYIKKESISIKANTLIAYGLLDDTVSIAAIKNAKNRYFSSESQVELLKLTNSSHILTVEPDWEELYEKILIFLKK